MTESEQALRPRKILLQFFLEHRFAYAISIISIIVSEVVQVQFPNLLGDFTTALQKGRLTSAGIGYYTVALTVVGVSYVTLFAIGQYRNGQLGRLFEYELRKRLFLHWETLHTSYFRTRSIGDLLNHAMNDVRTIREALSGGLNQLTNAIFLLIATLYMTIRTIDLRLTLTAIVPLLLIPVFVIWWGPRIRTSSRQVQEALSSMADLTEESFSAIRLIKATANERIEVGRFTARVNRIVDAQISMFLQSALFQSAIPLMGSISFAIALLYGGYLTIHGDITLGKFVAFTFYLGMLITPLQQIGQVVNTFQRASASVIRVQTLLTERPAITDPPHPYAPAHVAGNIALKITSFQYPDGERPALYDVHVDIAAGQTIGIVGRTASGKTTLVNLLPRVFDPPPHTVFLDGVDVRDYKLSTLREAIAYVPQDGFLFSTTIGENIRFGDADASPDTVMQAATDAAFADDIARFRDGMDTQIGERGVTLSGGQKQRASLARAFLKDAPVLILDDSLSAVDMNTEKTLIARLQGLRKGKTTLIIAHRLSAVRAADQILVLEEGQLAESGTHDELMARGGLYADMYRLQDTGGVSAS